MMKLITIENIDLSDTGVLAEMIDTVRWAYASFQVVPSGVPASTAVVEVLRSYDPNGITAESFDTAVELTLDGSSIETIDILDVPFLKFNVTTAETDRAVRIIVRLHEEIVAEYDEQTIELDDVSIRTEITKDHEVLVIKPYPVFGSLTTGQVTLKYYLDSDFPISFSPAKNFGKTSLDAMVFENGDYVGISVSCSNSQADQMLKLFIYSRDDTHATHGADAEIRNTTDGGGSAPTAAMSETVIEKNIKIDAASIHADVSGSIVATIKRTRSGTTITMGTVTLSSAQTIRDTDLSSWTATDLEPGDILVVDWGAGTTLTKATLTLGVVVK